MVADHKIEHISGKIVWLKDQYQGLAEKNGIAVPFSYARRTEASVEIHPLNIYDEVEVVVSNG